ncbi:hypothetical protein MTO96_036359 [Rhipicephalus appendiculatus]
MVVLQAFAFKESAGGITFELECRERKLTYSQQVPPASHDRSSHLCKRLTASTQVRRTLQECQWYRYAGEDPPSSSVKEFPPSRNARGLPASKAAPLYQGSWFRLHPQIAAAMLSGFTRVEAMPNWHSGSQLDKTVCTNEWGPGKIMLH